MFNSKIFSTNIFYIWRVLELSVMDMKNMSDLISIIIPVYNAEKYLEKCLDSLINQTYTNIEIILVDDGSTDNSYEICNEYSKRDNRIIVIKQENQGVSSARNHALDISHGAYVGFVDSDDFIEAHMYEVLYNNMIEYSSDLSMCNYYTIRGGKNEHREFNFADGILIINDKKTFYELLPKEYFKGFLCNKLFKKDIIGALRLNTEIYLCEDMLFVAKYVEKCSGNMCFDNKALYNYVINTNGATSAKVSKKTLSVLTSLSLVMDIVKNNVDINLDDYLYEYFYWSTLILNTKDILNNEKRNTIRTDRNRMYKKLLLSPEIGVKKKLKTFVLRRFYGVFQIMKKLRRI